MAETEERMTARGVRSSWDAAATNCICSFLFCSMGASSFLVKKKEKRDSRKTAARSIRAK